jgi:gliding motility-associated-like protein
MQKVKIYLLPVFFYCCIAGFSGKAQTTLCPPNIDFEMGNLTNWECKTGRVESIAGVNTVTWEATGVNTLNHKIIPRASAGVDQYGGFSEASPIGGAYSVRLGNNFFQTISAEGMFYTFTIPQTATIFSILFQYAVVFQDPLHNPDEQPRFRTSVFNVTDNQVIDCSNFDYTASASLPGFQTSTVDPTVIYKDWTPVTLNLSGLAGKTIRLEFITSDCTFRGHFGYAYIDVSSSCSGAVGGTIACPDAATASLVAPHGFQSYTWYNDNTFSSVISSAQTLLLNPVPPAGTSFPVVVGPYPGFGCPDTIMAVLSTAPMPIANAGADAVVCAGGQAQLGTATVSGHGYSWQPASLLMNPTVATPQTIANLNGINSFYLTVTDSITGCKNYDTVQVAPVTIDTAMLMIGDTVFCSNKPVTTSLHALTAKGSIQWYENGIAVGGANGSFFNPQPTLSSNTYWAVIQDGLCVNMTRPVNIKLLPVPVVDFSTDPSEQCINGAVNFFNKSTVQGDTISSYQWQLSDGRRFGTKNLELNFSRPGSVDIWLKAISKDGCVDSATKKIQIVETCGVYVPTAFTPDDDGKNDLFGPIFYGLFKLRRFSVYDRNGFVVFSTKTIGERWDGRHKGVKVASSVFVWILEYETVDGKPVVEKGTVTLIR